MCPSAASLKPALKNSFAVFVVSITALAAELPPNRWVELRRDPAGARPGSAIRYAPDTHSFYLWGYMNADPELLQEHPLMAIPEYDVVAFDPDDGQWRSQREKFTAAYIPRTYSGKTTGSERTLLRGPTEERGSSPRPDLNIVFDQVAYHPGLKSLVYFTGGLTAAYHVRDRRWRDLAPAHSPPPVLGGSLAYDPVNDQLVLFGGGHVVERGTEGRVAGYTGTWLYQTSNRDWRLWPLLVSPPPRMNTRMVGDTRNQALVLFGGDGQDRYLADTWLFDLKTQSWRASKAQTAPAARAGHFTVYDPETGWVIIGGGYNTRDLTDMWAYDAKQDRWQRLPGEVPTGFYVSADIAPEKRLILLVTSATRPGDKMSCNILYPVRTTYAYRIAGLEPVADSAGAALAPISKQPPAQDAVRRAPKPIMFPNQWLNLTGDGPSRPTRTWGSATFDTSRGLILYWGGGHCGYEGDDADAFEVETQTWRDPRGVTEYPERLWDHGVRLAGVTFRGGPWTDHGRKTYAYDPVSRKMILVRSVRLATGYEPEALQLFPARRTALVDAVVNPPSSYVRYGTWSYDPDTGQWELLGGAPAGVDTLVTTRHGVMGINVDWPSRINDAGYQLPFNASKPNDTAIYLFDAARRTWKRLNDSTPGPQHLYEMTSLAYDSKRDQVILHGAGPKRDELWAFELAAYRWRNMQPQGAAPACSREAVYIPHEDVFLTYGPAPEDRTLPALWAYKVGENNWQRLDIPPMTDIDPPTRAGQNRAMVYDADRDLIFLVLGTRGDQGRAVVYAMRYRHASARRK